MSSLLLCHVDAFGHGAVTGAGVPALGAPSEARRKGSRGSSGGHLGAGLPPSPRLPLWDLLPDVVMFEHCRCAPADERRFTGLLLGLGNAGAMRFKNDPVCAPAMAG